MAAITSHRSELVTVTARDYPMNLKALREFVAEADRLQLSSETVLMGNTGNGLQEINTLQLVQSVLAHR